MFISKDALGGLDQSFRFDKASSASADDPPDPGSESSSNRSSTGRAGTAAAASEPQVADAPVTKVASDMSWKSHPEEEEEKRELDAWGDGKGGEEDTSLFYRNEEEERAPSIGWNSMKALKERSASGLLSRKVKSKVSNRLSVASLPFEAQQQKLNEFLEGEQMTREDYFGQLKGKFDKNGDGIFQEDEVDCMLEHVAFQNIDKIDAKRENKALMAKIMKLRTFMASGSAVIVVLIVISSVAAYFATSGAVDRSNVDIKASVERSTIGHTALDGQGHVHLQDKRGTDISIRSFGDTFQAIPLVDQSGRKLYCMNLNQVAAATNDLAAGTVATLTFEDEFGAEKKIIPMNGEYEDRHEVLSFASNAIHVHLDSDACNNAKIAAPVMDIDNAVEAVPQGNDVVEDEADKEVEDEVSLAEEKKSNIFDHKKDSTHLRHPARDLVHQPASSKSAILERNRSKLNDAKWALRNGRHLQDDDTYVTVTSGSAASASSLDTIPHKKVFVTSERYTGNLGGISGANAKCNNLATAAGLPGTYKAWLSKYNGFNPKNHFDHSNPDDPYYLVDGTTKVADNWQDLTDGALKAAIKMNEKGAILLNSVEMVWTGTNKAGSPNFVNANTNANCGGWKKQSIFLKSYVGLAGRTDSQWTKTDTKKNCGGRWRLYCFQQDVFIPPISTYSPTDSPTQKPTDSPTDSPSKKPTDSPSKNPSASPTTSPTDSPTQKPTDSPSKNPSASPTVSASPTTSPTDSPTQKPTACIMCSDTRTPNMITQNLECHTAPTLIRDKCNKEDFWILNSYCERSCHAAGFGYVIGSCCESAM